LEFLLEPFPDICIVLSTSWVRVIGFEQARSRLTQAVQRRVIGATFERGVTDERDFQSLTRAEQIIQDVERRKIESWLAIDDDAFRWPDSCRTRLIKTLGAYGLSDPAVQREVVSGLKLL